jgi:hypothetical protein
MLVSRKLPLLCVIISGLLAGCSTSEPSSSSNLSTSKAVETQSQRTNLFNDSKTTKWTGQGHQNNGSTWSILATLQGKSSLIEYPSLSCGGKWLLVVSSPSQATYKEKITHGNRCTNNGYVTLKKIADGNLNFSYSSTLDGKVSATAVLSPLGSKTNIPSQNRVVKKEVFDNSQFGIKKYPNRKTPVKGDYNYTGFFSDHFVVNVDYIGRNGETFEEAVRTTFGGKPIQTGSFLVMDATMSVGMIQGTLLSKRIIQGRKPVKVGAQPCAKATFKDSNSNGEQDGHQCLSLAFGTRSRATGTGFKLTPENGYFLQKKVRVAVSLIRRNSNGRELKILSVEDSEGRVFDLKIGDQWYDRKGCKIGKKCDSQYN